MKAQFDLRPADLLKKESKQKGFNPTRLLAVFLMLLFFMSTGYYLFMMGLVELPSMQDAVMEKENEVASFEAEKIVLQKQVNDLRAKEKVFADTLKIMQDDLPTIEVLNALETEMDVYGIGFNSLKFVIGRVSGNTKAPDSVELTGTVATDKQIVDYSDKLSTCGVFSDVNLTSTTLDEKTGMITFTLNMPVYPIGQIQQR